MKVEFLDPAEMELVSAVVYYNSESEGLGYEFAAEVNRTIGRMVEFPNAWTSLSKRTRRCRTSRFPYGIVYQLRGDDSILIVGVMHLHREPESWRCRLPLGER
jgi:plasmid stabilization system protein ParE